MINEIGEAKNYIRGHFDGKPPRRICFVMAKYYKRSGLPLNDALATVQKMLETAGIETNFSVGRCVMAAYENDSELNDGGMVKISRHEIDAIKRVASTRREKILAVALLCCAKAYAGEDGLFTISLSRLAGWIGCDTENLRKRELDILRVFGYVEILPPKETYRGWKKDEVKKNLLQYRVCIPYGTDGEFELLNNDIVGLCEHIFPEIVKHKS